MIGSIIYLKVANANRIVNVLLSALTPVKSARIT